jgi:hypothetical protein
VTHPRPTRALVRKRWALAQRQMMREYRKVRNA